MLRNAHAFPRYQLLDCADIRDDEHLMVYHATSCACGLPAALSIWQQDNFAGTAGGLMS